MSAKTVNVTYYAALREAAGISRETIVTELTTAETLFELLRERHGFKLQASQLRVSANSAFVPLLHELKEGDEIVFIPPVAGG